MSVIIVIWLVAINNRHNGFVVCRCLFIIHDAGIFIVGSFRLKHRACAIFTGVDSQHGSQRHRNLTRNATKARVKAHLIIRQFQIADSTRRNVEYDLPVTRIFHRNLHARERHIHHQVRRELVIQQPLIECTQQIGTTWC